MLHFSPLICTCVRVKKETSYRKLCSPPVSNIECELHSGGGEAGRELPFPTLTPWTGGNVSTEGGGLGDAAAVGGVVGTRASRAKGGATGRMSIPLSVCTKVV